MERKHLRRSSVNKVLCGVCGGIGEYIHMDPTWLRLIWILLILFRPGGHLFHPIFGYSILAASLITYLAAAVIMPRDR